MTINEITVDSYDWYFKTIVATNEKILKSITGDAQKKLDQLKGMAKTALQPFLKIMKLKPSILTYQATALLLQKALLPTVEFMAGIPLTEIAGRQRGLSKADGSEEIKYIVVMTKALWPPLFDIPIAFIRNINAKYQELGQDAFRAWAEKEITGYYDKKGINRLMAGWSLKRGLGNRLPILKAALGAHNNGKYELSVPALITQIESVLDKIKSSAQDKLKFERFIPYIDALFSGKNDCLPLKGMIIDAIAKDLKWSDKTLSALCRHALLHGAWINSANHMNSLKLILILDMLIHLL